MNENPEKLTPSGTLADKGLYNLNQGDTFGVFDARGDVHPLPDVPQGVFHRGTRHVSLFRLTVEGAEPLLLGTAIKEDNEELAIDLTTERLASGARERIPYGTLHIRRSVFFHADILFQSIGLRNYADRAVDFRLEIAFGSDFRDLFEIRGLPRRRRGTMQPPGIDTERGTVRLRYHGLDDVERFSSFRFTPAPDSLAAGEAIYRISLPPHGSYAVDVCVACGHGRDGSRAPDPETALAAVRREIAGRKAATARIETSNRQLDDWINRSAADLLSLLAETPSGRYPYAGVPWFNTPFGRDGIVTAFQTLWMRPEIARDVLLYLAATQAREEDPAVDAEPGKIFHERRHGEMVGTGEVPFGLYYGSVDTTPLFVALAGAWYRRTGDLALLRELWPSIRAALAWIDRYGDRDEDGLIEYEKRTPSGLDNQGWKDSPDSVSHADGSPAPPPIALCEVQAYAYLARTEAAAMARALGEDDFAVRLTAQAEELGRIFHERFWDEELEAYCLALDRDKRPCRVVSSNAGHALWAGIVPRDFAHRLCERLLQADMFSGWGIRTLSTQSPRYNPISYHNGSIWPHDCSLIALGMARYGFTEGPQRLLGALFDAALHFEGRRMIELYCGFDRRGGEGPVPYPVACSPQAWAVGAVFALLQAALNIEIDAAARRVLFHRPALPDFLESFRIIGLPLGSETASFELHRFERSVGVNVLSRPEDWKVLVVS